MRYIGDGKVSSRARITASMRRIPRVYRIWPGLGSWRASRRDTGAYIGWFTLKYVPDTVEVEIGYRLLREAWGQGFATEGASELVRYGFDTVGLYRIIGLTHRDNVASQRVLTKIGLGRRGERAFPHPAYSAAGPMAWFERDAESWRRQFAPPPLE